MALAAGNAEGSTEPIQETETPSKGADERPAAGGLSPALYFESKQKILDLLRLFSEHGYVNSEDVATALNRSAETVFPKELADLKQRVRDLEDAIRSQKLANELASWELEETQSAMESQRGLLRESVVHIATLEARLKDARRTTLKLIAASRNSLTTLKRVRDHLATQAYVGNALAPLIHDFRELTQAVQELHVLSAIQASAAPPAPEVR